MPLKKKLYVSFKKFYIFKKNFTYPLKKFYEKLRSDVESDGNFSMCFSTCGSDCSFGCRCRFRSAPASSLSLPVPEVVLHAALIHYALRRSLCASL